MVSVYCRTTKRGEQSFYLIHAERRYYLFTQAFRRSNQEYFGNGILLKDVYDFSRVHSYATERTLEKIQRFIPYIEKEHDIVIRRKTERRSERCKKLLSNKPLERGYKGELL